MPSIWVKWRLSPFDYVEITINDVVGEAVHGAGICEARAEMHSDKMYLVVP